MRPYLTLLIKDRLAAWNPMSNQRAGQTKSKAILSFAGFCVLALFLYGMLVVLEYNLFQGFVKMGEPEMMLGLVCLLCAMLTLFTSFFFVLSTLFFSRDVQFVSSLPITSRGILMAKMTMVMLSEAGIAILVCLPTILLYGIQCSMGVAFYLKALLIVPLIPAIPLAISTLLSFLLIRISGLWKRRESVTTIASFVLMAVFIFFEMKLTSSGGDESMTEWMTQLLLKQRHMLQMLTSMYPPAGWMANALVLTGVQGWLYTLLFIVVGGGLISLFAFVFGGSYQRLAVKQEEIMTRLNAQSKRRVTNAKTRSPEMALYRREVREIFTVPINASNCLAGAVLFPIVAVFTYSNVSNADSVMDGISQLMKLAPSALYCAIVTAVMMMIGSVNMAAATSVSREGKLNAFFRTIPVDGTTRLRAKLWMSMTISFISLIPMTILLCALLPGLIKLTLLAVAATVVFQLFSNAISIIRDIKHPRLDWKTETEAIKQNSQAAISMFLTIGFVGIIALAFWGLTSSGLSTWTTFFVLLAVIAVAAVVTVSLLLGKFSKQYSQQEIGA